MKTKTLTQTILFEGVHPHEVFELLMDSQKHAALTGAPANISRDVDGSIEAYNGYITGKNLTIVQDKTIVQKWHAADWESSHVSIVRFEFAQSPNGTILTFTHEGIPESSYEGIKVGWEIYYWKVLRAYCMGKRSK